MQITVSGHHMDVTPALRSYVSKKFERIERHFDNITNVHVVLSVEKQIQKAEVNVHVAGNDLHADATHDDLYAAIDTMLDKLDRQVRKYKEKLTDHHRSEGGLKAQS
jgi:putative sigma-54 modulation protein